MLRYQHYSSSLSGQVFFYEAITTYPRSYQDDTDKQVSIIDEQVSATCFKQLISVYYITQDFHQNNPGELQLSPTQNFM